MFNPSVTLQSSTQYFVFTDSQPLVDGSNSDDYPGGTSYLSSGGAAYSVFVGDANFALNGTAVPEPNALLGVAAGLMAIAALRRKIKSV